jgi:hypothetical protein
MAPKGHKMLNIYITSIKQGIFWGVLNKGTFFFLTLLYLPKFIICTHLTTINFILFFISKFENLNLFKFLL